MHSKQNFIDAIEEHVAKRKETLTKLVNATKTEIDEDEILDLAEEAYDYLVKIRETREEMRKMYPPLCNCNCHQEEEEKK